MPTSEITLRRPVRAIDQVRAAGALAEAGLPSLAAYAPEWNDVVLHCPDCGGGTGLRLRGRWGESATLVCPCAHTWHPEAADATWGVRAMQTAIAAAVRLRLPPDAATGPPDRGGFLVSAGSGRSGKVECFAR